MKFVISTQVLKNYGAHCEDGKFSSGNARWKMKGGEDYCVTGLDRIQDALAFVASKAMYNEIELKEFPVKWQTYEEWEAKLPEDEEYREFLLDRLEWVSPRGTYD